MKKLLLTLLFVSVWVFANAQDVIVTKDSKRIDAKIMEVSKSEIKYKSVTNLEGPTFTLGTDEINTIIYSDGTVQTFDSKSQTATDKTTQNQTMQSAQKESDEVRDPYLVYEEDDVYYLGDMRMNEEEFYTFLKNNCPAAWESKLKGDKLWGLGWGLFTGGMIVEFALGVPLLACGAAYGDQALAVGGTVGAVFGSLAVTASIPCIVVGAIKRNTPEKVYNEKCSSSRLSAAMPRRTADITFGLQAGGNGVGLAMNF